MTQNQCPDCGSAMEQGFIPDAAYAQCLQLAWQRGLPERAKIFGMDNGIKRNLKECVEITADRCTGCGLLKLYARQGEA